MKSSLVLAEIFRGLFSVWNTPTALRESRAALAFAYNLFAFDSLN